jgi:hypothetical protein
VTCEWLGGSKALSGALHHADAGDDDDDDDDCGANLFATSRLIPEISEQFEGAHHCRFVPAKKTYEDIWTVVCPSYQHLSGAILICRRGSRLKSLKP